MTHRTSAIQFTSHGSKREILIEIDQRKGDSEQLKGLVQEFSGEIFSLQKGNFFPFMRTKYRSMHNELSEAGQD